MRPCSACLSISAFRALPKLPIRFGSSNCRTHKSHTILALKKGKDYELRTITNKNHSKCKY